MSTHAQESYIAGIKDRIAARKGKPGYAKNVEHLEAELARAEAIQAAEKAALDTAP